MDLGSADIAVGTPPQCIDGHTLCWPGAFLPLLVPLECLTPSQRAAALSRSAEVPLALRVKAELDVGQDERAWQLLAHVTDPLSVPTGLDEVLRLWSARTLADLGLPGGRGPLLIIGNETSSSEDQQTTATAAAEGLQAVYNLLDPWPWPRWVGPLVIIGDARALAGLPAGMQSLARPALPMIRLRLDSPSDVVARQLCRLALALSVPPKAGWPDWLTTGLGELAAAKAKNLLVSPHRMLGLRQAAGMTGLSELMSSTTADPPLSEAVTAYLLHPSRRANLPSFLDLLRNGATSQGALQVAYNLTLQQLLEEH